MMRVRCMINDRALISEPAVADRLSASIRVDGPLYELEVGTVYDVWGIEVRAGDGVWVHVHSIPGAHFPSPYPAEFFEFVDTAIPAGWAIAVEADAGHAAVTRIGFAEWAGDRGFYERLIDGDEQAVAVYEGHRLRAGQA